MRYPKAHKAETRERILRHAAEQFREKGVRGIGVADLMKQAGLTHGGFYGHFPTKDSLVAEAMGWALETTTDRLQRWAERAPPGEGLRAIVDGYLTGLHRDTPGAGCAIAALGAELSRESPEARRAVTDRIDRLLDIVAEQLPAPSPEESRRAAMAALATMVGTLILSRMVDRPDLSDEILEAGRQEIMGNAPPAA